jgi:hypothetical protein
MGDILQGNCIDIYNKGSAFGVLGSVLRVALNLRIAELSELPEANEPLNPEL